jgi:hypothetical protein
VVKDATVATSEDAKTWRAPVPMTAQETDLSECVRFSAPLNGGAKYLKVSVQKKPGAKRILLGEIVVHQPMPTGGRVRVPTPLHVKQVLDKTS